jgi:hypothetical protein
MRPVYLALSLAACAPEPVRTEVPTAAEPPHAAAIAPEPIAAPPAPPVEENDPRWHPILREIAAGYAVWGRVDDQMRWAPAMCAMPQPARARISASGDESTHGRKLYTLYAKDPEAYGAPASFMKQPEQPALAGLTQVVVKEAFKPVETASDPGMRELRPAEHEGKRYVPGDALGIYVVFKPAKPVGDTDAGWVYGTVAKDMQTVTSAGRVASCMGCHKNAKRERLFGTDPIVVPRGPGPDGRHH